MCSLVLIFVALLCLLLVFVQCYWPFFRLRTVAGRRRVRLQRERDRQFVIGVLRRRLAHLERSDAD